MNDARHKISIADTDQCVKCGLCLPHCPTWKLTGSEADSPRGRISIMQALARGAFEPDAASATHLQRCIGCLNCERVCPANVPYARLIDAGRAVLVANRRLPARAERVAATVLGNRLLRKLAFGLAQAVHVLRLTALARRSKRFQNSRYGRLERWLRPVRRVRLKRRYEPAGAMRGHVQLFTGCVGPALDADTVTATVTMLTTLGFRVDIPRGQRCCGALWLHAGYPERAARLAQRNVDAFAGDTPVIAPASGCAATLMEYGRVTPQTGADRFAARVIDPVSFAMGHGLAACTLGPVRLKAVLHAPCTLTNALKADVATRAALARIPDLAVTAAAPGPGCCGGAGAYALSQPDLASALDAGTFTAIRSDAPDVVLTSNIGCALSIGRDRGDDTLKVRHPVSVIAEALSGVSPI